MKKILFACGLSAVFTSLHAYPTLKDTAGRWVAADAKAYTNGKTDGWYVIGVPLPDGYSIQYRGYKPKGDTAAVLQEWDRKFSDIFAKIEKSDELPSETELKELRDYFEANFDMGEHVDYTSYDEVLKNSRRSPFEEYYCLVTPNGTTIPAENYRDVNVEELKKIGYPDAEGTSVISWKNPEYKQPDATCKPGEGSAASETKEVAVSLPQTTKEFIFEGSDFSQKFQVVATAEEVAAVPGGLETISERVVQLFKDMPKVGATIIGRMVTTDGTLGVCPIVDEIEGQQFKAAIMFAADTTVDQAKALADDLDKKFSVLKEQVMADMKGNIDAEHQRLMEEHKQKLAYHEARAEAAKQGDVNIGSADTQSQAVDHMGNPVASAQDKALEKQRNQQDLLEGINGLQKDVGDTIGVLKKHSSIAGSETALAQPVFG